MAVMPVDPAPVTGALVARRLPVRSVTNTPVIALRAVFRSQLAAEGSTMLRKKVENAVYRDPR